MAIAYFPRCNPFQFRSDAHYVTVQQINYNTVMPRFDMMSPDTQYIKGEYPVQNFKLNALVGHNISFQVQNSTTYMRFWVTKISYQSVPSIRDSVWFSETNITPVGWVGNKVSKLNFTPTIAGDYVIRGFINYQYRSWYFQTHLITIHEDLSDKGIIKLQYKNSYNDFGMVFDDYYTSFYTAKFKPEQGTQESIITQSDTGVSKQKSTRYAGFSVIFTDIPNLYYDQLCTQLQCNDLIINGMKCICNETPEITETEKSNVIDVKANLVYQGSNTFLDIF